jgi:DNA-binding phage protein
MPEVTVSARNTEVKEMATATRRKTEHEPTERSPVFHLIDGLRARRRMSITAVAKAAGLSRDTLYAISNPRISTVRKLADALGMPVSRLASKVSEVESVAESAKPASPKPRCR